MATTERGLFVQEHHGSNQAPTFLGIPIGQWWHDLQLWEWFLNVHDVARIIEIGTSSGGMSAFLALQCQSRAIGFTSFDISASFEETIGRNPFLRPLVMPALFCADTWGSGGAHVRDALRAGSRRPVLVFCDGDNKPREYRTFAPLLQPGDFLAVHDWMPTVEAGGEFHPSDVDDTLTETVWGEICDAHQSHTRFFKKRA